MFLEKSCKKYDGETFARSFSQKSTLSISLLYAEFRAIKMY